uniref:MINDY family member 4B n=1 Tax=Gopherus evgoodei TaxID=1825980 RepID=A0A8C4W659_9SAUR
MLFGNTFHVFSYEWKKSYFKFHAPYSDLFYALESVAKLPLTAVAAHAFHPVFSSNFHLDCSRRCKGNKSEELTEETSQPIMGNCHNSFFVVVFYQFKDEGSHGVILFLYSLLFSRTLERACPHVFNGFQKFDSEDGVQELLHGVLARSDVDYLHWNKEEVEHYRPFQVGSMLKTPKLPIWLCNINGTYSVLFSTNRLHLSDWKMEHIFDLYLYNGQPSQKKTVHLTVDTHSHHWEKNHCEESDPEKRFPFVEMAIRTKREGAAINWNGAVPFFRRTRLHKCGIHCPVTGSVKY